VHHRTNEAGQLFFRAGPCPTFSLFILRRREDKRGPIQLIFLVAKPDDWLERGVEAGKKEI
jgi:hypothetical protein